MTATETLETFIATLNGKIESASLCVQDAAAFQQVSADIEHLISTDLASVLQAFGDAGPAEADRQRLEDSLARLVELEQKSSARLVWAQDFEDYVRKVASETD